VVLDLSHGAAALASEMDAAVSTAIGLLAEERSIDGSAARAND
jgi:hypothetical protein